jgi:nitroimidazol reductase NimA-like FMN-containing flavoprotein (pyridoxamine 5'-phosphate oxidase superfamily)
MRYEEEIMLESDHDEDGWSPQGPVTELSQERNWELLEAAAFGRLGVSVDNKPRIYPVNYCALGRSILFRTAAGSKLQDLLANREVVFEVDGRTDHATWSVIVDGTAQIVNDPDEIAGADRLPMPHWIPTATYVWVKITPSTVTGRRFLRHLEVSRHHGAWL